MSDALLPVCLNPYNAETPMSRIGAPITPTDLFYVRSHFPVPTVDARTFTLRVTGLVEKSLSLTLLDLARLPQHHLTVTMECAGNGRKLMDPLPPGVTWNLGAVSTARFGGPKLADVLRLAGLKREAIELLCIGADLGHVEGAGVIAYERSLPTVDALQDDVVLATTMNDEPLTPAHGYPVRMMVPGWYGMASVKWLTELRAIATPFTGFYQATHYVYRPGDWRDAEDRDGTPLSKMKPRALITSLADGTTIPAGQAVHLSGCAWSGFGAIRNVAFSADGGRTWTACRIGNQASEYAQVSFEADWTPPAPGEYLLSVRAQDTGGRQQPVDPVKDALGYGNNSVQRLRVIAT